MINYVKGLQRETEDKDGNGPFGFSSQEALLTRAERLSVVLPWKWSSLRIHLSLCLSGILSQLLVYTCNLKNPNLSLPAPTYACLEQRFKSQSHQQIPNQSVSSESKGFKGVYLGSWVSGLGFQ